MTYLWLSVVFVLVALVVLLVAWLTSPSPKKLVSTWWLPVLAAGVVVMVLTAIFDNVMISLGLVRYGEIHLAGAFVGVVPVEDFTYPLAALLLLPALWLLLGRGRSRER